MHARLGAGVGKIRAKGWNSGRSALGAFRLDIRELVPYMFRQRAQAMFHAHTAA